MQEKFIRKLTECVREEKLDAVLICPGGEMEFLMGFCPMFCERFQGLVLKSDGSMFYICNLIYRDEMKKKLPESVPVYTWFDGDDMTDMVGQIFREQGLFAGKIAVNSDARAFQILELMEKTEVSFVSGRYLMEAMRMIKDSEEQKALRDSAAIADRVFTEVQEIIRPGVTEKEIQDFLLRRMTELGGENPECIVGVGANSSYPHYTGSEGILGKQDVVLLDYGCTYHGLYSDMSRTLFVGGVTEKQREAYELVKKANEAAEELTVEGAWIPDLDAKAREVLDEKGYAHTLLNRLGHGIGYSVHEAPDIKQSNKRQLEKGMAFSIEPGIYLGGEFGIRIEDIVMINEKGEREVLNRSTKELIVL